MKTAKDDEVERELAELEFQMRVNMVKDTLRLALQQGRKLEDISAVAYVGVSTMKNLLDGVTKRPTAWTLDRVMYACGWRPTYLPADLPRLEYEPPVPLSHVKRAA